MNKHFRVYLLVCSLVAVLQPIEGLAQQNSGTSTTSAKRPPAERDGQHDFDFEVGRWNIHLKRLEHRLTGSTTWVEFDGTSVTRKVWDGRADLEEFETDSPAGGHIEGLTLRLYDPQTHQWSLYWASSKSGAMGPPTIGEFKNGRGEFFDTEPSGPNGRAILVRFVWSDITPNSETNWEVKHTGVTTAELYSVKLSCYRELLNPNDELQSNEALLALNGIKSIERRALRLWLKRRGEACPRCSRPPGKRRRA